MTTPKFASQATYANATKRQWRERATRSMANGRDMGQLTGLILSGPEGSEIPHLRRRGMKARNLVLVDKFKGNTRRAAEKHNFRSARQYECSLVKACRLLAESGELLDFASLDFHGFISKGKIKELRAMFETGVFYFGSCICINSYIGRDHWAENISRRFFGADRLQILIYAIETITGREISVIDRDEYMGGSDGRSRMAWITIELGIKKKVTKSRQNILEKLLQMPHRPNEPGTIPFDSLVSV